MTDIDKLSNDDPFLKFLKDAGSTTVGGLSRRIEQ